jgi:hypothetical protein
MFGLAPFAGAPFASILQASSSVSPSGLQATATLGSIGISSGVMIGITGVQGTTSLGTLNSSKGPVYWTAVITEQ